MTKEQREYVSQHLRDLIAHDEHEGEDSDLPAFRAALPLLTDGAELQRSVGEAVIANREFAEWMVNQARKKMRTSSGFCPADWDALNAIARALREGGR